MDSIILPATQDSLPAIRNYVFSTCSESALPEGLASKIDLVLEELIVNVCCYAYGNNKGNVTVVCRNENHKISLTISDRGMPFNPLENAAPEIHADIDQRKIGGLGIYLVKEMVDDIRYERNGDTNSISVTWILKPPSTRGHES